MPFFRSGILALIAAANLSCTPSDDSTGAKQAPTAKPGEKTYRIAVIPKGTTHDFWKSIHAGALKAERELSAGPGPKVKVDWKGPPREDDRAQQITVVQNFIAAGVSGIVLAPLDDTALMKPVGDAMKAKIPVVVFDSGLKGEAGKDFVAYVATNNYQGGVLGAKRLGEVLGGKGKAILLRYQEGSESTSQREKGFLDTMKKDFPGVEFLSTDMYAGAIPETSYQRAQNLITSFREKGVDGIFTPNESATFGMLRALKDAGLAKKVKLVGFDASAPLVQGMKAGEIQGLVLQNPIRMGYLGVKTLYDHLEGRKVEPVTDTGSVMLTPENMDQPDMKLLHSPDLSEWLGK